MTSKKIEDGGPDLSALIEKLEKAERPSRRLDAEISAVVEPHLFDAPGFTPIRPIPNFRYDSGENVIRFDGGGLMDVRFFPPVTSSIDAAVSLAERVIPGWGMTLDAVDGIATDLYFISPKYRDDRPSVNSSGPIAGKPIALGIVLATLRALQSRGEA